MEKSVEKNRQKSSESGRQREMGNGFYRRAYSSSDAQETGELLLNAMRQYRAAILASKTQQEYCLAQKNLGLAGWKLAAHKGSELENDFVTSVDGWVADLFVEAVADLSKAVEAGRHPLGYDWATGVIRSIKGCFKSSISYLESLAGTEVKQKTRLLERMAEACGDDGCKAHIFLHVAQTYMEFAVVALADEDMGGFCTALSTFRDCYFPIEEAKKRLKSAKELEGDVESVEVDVFFNTCVAESLQKIQEGDQLQEDILDICEELNMDGIHLVMDKYREAIVLTRGVQVEYEAMAYSKLGQVYNDILKIESRAKEYFTTSVQLASTCERNFAGDDWFDEAADVLRQIQEREKRKEDEELAKTRDPYLKELDEEMQMLEVLRDYNKTSLGKLMKELPTKLPPKHKPDKEIPGQDMEEKQLNALSASEQKKLLQKLILLYHPDHVDKEQHGMKYFVLCEEITKVFTAKYEYLKG